MVTRCRLGFLAFVRTPSILEVVFSVCIWSCVALAQAAEPPVESYVIRVQAPSRSADLEVYSFITGTFGGVGEYRSKPLDKERIFIPTEYEGKSAKTLKAILYIPGCQLQLIRVDNLQLGPREAEFSCIPLPTIRLEGKIGPVPIQLGKGSELWVRYLAPWSHPFLGIFDGPVMALDAGTALIQSDGCFAIDSRTLARRASRRTHH